MSAQRRDLERELQGYDGEWPDAWRPQVGETLVGVIERYSTGQSNYGPVRTVIVRRDNGSRVSLWLSSEVLRRHFEQEAPRVGERIGLRFHGKHATKGYKRYTLLVDRPEPEAPDFSPLGGERGDGDEDATAPYAAATVMRPGSQAPRSARPSPPHDPNDPFGEEGEQR